MAAAVAAAAPSARRTCPVDSAASLVLVGLAGRARPPRARRSPPPPRDRSRVRGPAALGCRRHELIDVLIDANQFVELGDSTSGSSPCARSGHRGRGPAPCAAAGQRAHGGGPGLGILPAELSGRRRGAADPASRRPLPAGGGGRLRAHDAGRRLTGSGAPATRCRGSRRPSPTSTDWDVRAVLAAATFLADDDLTETSAHPGPDRARRGPAGRRRCRSCRPISTTGASSTPATGGLRGRSGTRGARRGAHRTARGDRVRRCPSLRAGHDRLGARALRRGRPVQERIGEDTVCRPSGPSWSGEPRAGHRMLEALDLTFEPDGPVVPIEVELQPHLLASHAFELVGDRTRATAAARARGGRSDARYGSDARLALALRRQASSARRGSRARSSRRQSSSPSDVAPSRRCWRRTASRCAAWDARRRRRASSWAPDGRRPSMGMERVRAMAHRELLAAGGLAAVVPARSGRRSPTPSARWRTWPRRTDEQRDRRAALRHDQDGGDPSERGVSQAGDPRPRRARSCARRCAGHRRLECAADRSTRRLDGRGAEVEPGVGMTLRGRCERGEVPWQVTRSGSAG